MSYASINEILTPLEQINTLSDVHLSAGEPVSYRSIGEIVSLEKQPKVTKKEMELFTKETLARYPGSYELYLKNKEIDFNFYSVSNTPYRVNAFFKNGHMALAMRKISYKPFHLEELMYEDFAQIIKTQVLNRKTGLFLVTGPTGSGKSTSLIAMLQYLNETRKEHIVTIEDPIEFIFKPKNCLISQRELGIDTLSYTSAMRSVVREDPNIIFVGEIRDPDTAEAAMNLAETGHLVFSTLHTRSAATTVHRIVSLFPSDIQSSARDRLAASLLGVQSQFLLPTKDGKGRIGLFELMLNTTAIKNDIRKNEGKTLDAIIETSRQRGMISHIEYAKRLIADGHIQKSDIDRLV